MTNTGEAIRAIREELGESQQAFSNRLGTTLVTVSRWEQNRFTPSPKTLARLAHIAREHHLENAAKVLDRESGLLFHLFGLDQLTTVRQCFASIALVLTKVSLEHSLSAVEKEKLLTRALKDAMDGEALALDLIAMAPHIGPAGKK